MLIGLSRRGPWSHHKSKTSNYWMFYFYVNSRVQNLHVLRIYFTCWKNRPVKPVLTLCVKTSQNSDNDQKPVIMAVRCIQGFWQVAEEKVKFRGIFTDKFAEKLADFTGVFGANFTKKQSVKNGRFCGYFQGKFCYTSVLGWSDQHFWHCSNRGHHYFALSTTVAPEMNQWQSL